MRERKYPDNFLGIEPSNSSYEGSKIVVLPLSYDRTASYQKGTADGPEAVITASQQVELYDIETDSEPYKKGGVCTLQTLKLNSKKTPDDVIETVYKEAKKLISDGKIISMIGGEHSLSSPVIRAYKEKYPQLSVLQFDAHSDLRDSYDGTKWSHASIMKRVVDMRIPSVQVGIRSTSPDGVEVLKKNKDIIRCFWAKDIVGAKDERWMEEALGFLTKDVYITFDVDGFDSSIMRGTGTPEPGGFDWNLAQKMLKLVCANRNIVGFDVVELRPIEGDAACDFLTAKLTYTIMGYVLASKR